MTKQYPHIPEASFHPRKDVDHKWNPPATRLYHNPSSAFHEQIEAMNSTLATDIAQVVRYTLLKLQNLPSSVDVATAKKLADTINSPEISGHEFRKDPMEAWRLCKEEMTNVESSPTADAIKDFVSHIYDMHQDFFNICISQARGNRAWDNLYKKGQEVAQSAHEARLERTKFGTLLDDHNFIETKEKWEESRNFWAERDVVRDNHAAHAQIAHQQELIKETQDLVGQYAQTIAKEPTKVGLVNKMLGSLVSESQVLEVEDALISTSMTQELAHIAKSGKEALREAAELRARKEEAAVDKATIASSIIVDSMQFLKKDLGYKQLGSTQEAQIITHLREYLETKSLTTPDKKITTELAANIKSCINTSIFSSSVEIDRESLAKVTSPTLDARTSAHEAVKDIGDLISDKEAPGLSGSAGQKTPIRHR